MQSLLAGNAPIPDNTSEAEILARLKNAITRLPPCEDGCVRLWRAAVIDSEKYKQIYKAAHREISDGAFIVDSEAKKKLADRLISKKDQLVGRFYSDSLKAALPYFLRHNDDVDAERVLYYIDTPMAVARNNYFANVSSNMLGAVHHENIFFGIIDAAISRTEIAKKALADLRPSGMPYDQNVDDVGIDFNQPQNRVLSFANEIDTPGRRAELARTRQIQHCEMINAYQTCKARDTKDEFYLPEGLVNNKRVSVLSITGKESIGLSEGQWKHIGAALDKELNPRLAQNRKALQFRSLEDAVQSWFGVSLDAAREM